MNEKIKVYELDFGDKNLLTTNPKDILNHIEAEMEKIEEDYDGELQYEITVHRMTQEEIDALPEWS